MRFFFFISFLLLFAGTRAQKPGTSDSLYRYQQTSNELKFLQTNMTQLISSSITKAGIASLGFTNTSGHFRKVQEPEYQKTVGLATEGFSTLGRFKTAGYFSFTRSWDDSLAWTQKSKNSQEQPYYFASAKAGPYLRQQYRMGGIISYNAILQKLFIGAGINYQYADAFRSIDPRLSAKDFSLILAPEISYRWHNTTAGIGLRWGYGKQNYSVGYKNSSYNTGSETYPERVNYIVRGYGNISRTTNTLIKKQKYSGLSANLSTRLLHWEVRGAAGYNVDEEDNAYPISGAIRDSLLATFQTETAFGTLLLQHQGRLGSQQVKMDITNRNGRDYNIMAGASTYTYRNTNFNIQYLMHFTTPAPTSFEVGASAEYDNTYRKDGISSHLLRYKSIQAGIQGTLYTTAGSDRIAVTLAPALRLPMHSELSIPPTQVNYFTKEVVYPDYIYQTTKTWESAITASYITRRLLKTFTSGFSGRLLYTQPLHTPETTLPASLIPNKHRLYADLSFNLYF